MSMTEPRELFLHDLRDIYYAEQLLTTALPKLAEEATDPKLKEGFEKHLQQTKEHVNRLEQVFAILDEDATGEKCPGIDGIKAEHDKFMKDEDPSPEICDAFLTGAGARAEHYEIAAYSGLITLGDALGERDAVELFEQNLADEKAALAELETAAKKLATAAKA
jgi:ferritin-like metal-binding protein YciE